MDHASLANEIVGAVDRGAFRTMHGGMRLSPKGFRAFAARKVAAGNRTPRNLKLVESQVKLFPGLFRQPARRLVPVAEQSQNYAELYVLQPSASAVSNRSTGPVAPATADVPSTISVRTLRSGKSYVILH